MGAQCGVLLKAACVAVNGLGMVRGLMLYQSLPALAKIPMKFGMFGEVKWCREGRPWFLMYPGLCLVMGLAPLAERPGKVPEWVTKPEIFQEIMETWNDLEILDTEIQRV